MYALFYLQDSSNLTLPPSSSFNDYIANYYLGFQLYAASAMRFPCLGTEDLHKHEELSSAVSAYKTSGWGLLYCKSSDVGDGNKRIFGDWGCQLKGEACTKGLSDREGYLIYSSALHMCTELGTLAHT